MSGIINCNHTSLNKSYGVLSFSHQIGDNRQNGFHNSIALLKNNFLLLKGGFEIIMSRCRGSYSKKFCQYSICEYTTLYQFSLKILT